MNIYSILDLKSGHAEHLYLFRADPEAIRAFAEIARDENTKIGKYPEDYALFKVGTWDGDKMAITPLNAYCLANAIEFRKGDN